VLQQCTWLLATAVLSAFVIMGAASMAFSQAASRADRDFHIEVLFNSMWHIQVLLHIGVL
jgi:hypothetical protein